MEVKQNFIAFVFQVPVKTVPLFFPIGKLTLFSILWHGLRHLFSQNFMFSSEKDIDKQICGIYTQGPLVALSLQT